MSTARSMLPAKKVKPVSAVTRPVEISNDNYTEAKLNRRGHELMNEMRNPRSPWTQAAAEQEFNQNKRIFERKFKNIPVAEAVEEDPKIVSRKKQTSIYDGATKSGFTVQHGRRTNRVVPMQQAGKRKKRRTKKNKKGGKWSKKYKKSINCRRPKGFSQKQYCKYGRKHKKKMSGGVAAGSNMERLMEAAGAPTDSSRVPHTNNINLYDNKGKLIGTTREGINALIALEDAFSGDAGARIIGFSDTVTDLFQDGEEEEMTQLLQENGFKDYNDMTDLHHLYSQAKEEARSVEEDVKDLEEEQEDEPLTEARIEDLINQKYIVRRNGVIYTVV